MFLLDVVHVFLASFPNYVDTGEFEVTAQYLESAVITTNHHVVYGGRKEY